MSQREKKKNSKVIVKCITNLQWLGILEGKYQCNKLRWFYRMSSYLLFSLKFALFLRLYLVIISNDLYT